MQLRLCIVDTSRNCTGLYSADTSITLSFAFDVSERVYTIEACAIPGGVYTTGA
jgi:hypothetical protein